jgi:predicted nuclease of predicted toxin-antitoxin system
MAHPKFLVDNGVSGFVADGLKAAGYDAVHVRDYGMQAATDDEILSRAGAEGRAVLSVDRDFTTLLALGRASGPSLLLLRGRVSQQHPSTQLALILANLPTVAGDLGQGSIVVLEHGRVRVRRLPSTGSTP